MAPSKVFSVPNAVHIQFPGLSNNHTTSLDAIRQGNIKKMNRCESTDQLLSGDLNTVNCRYFQHHHNYQKKTSISRFASIGDHMHKLQKRGTKNIPYKNEKIVCSETDAAKPGGMRLVKSGVDLLRQSVISLGAPDGLRSTEVDAWKELRGHQMMAATCTRYWGQCEKCQQTVHASKYFYCRNCLVVCHNSHYCWLGMQRICPAMRLDIFGWGEGTNGVDYRVHKELDLEFVYLGGGVNPQFNECAECSRILEPSLGRPCSKAPTYDEAGESGGIRKKHHRLLRNLLMHSSKEGGVETSPEDAKRVSVCHATGRYFCERCHWGDEWYIPGNIFVLNDASKHPVSRSAYLKLRILWDAAVIRVPSYWHRENEEAKRVYNIRIKFQNMRPYFESCQVAMTFKEIFYNNKAPHLLGQANFLRMVDVINILNGTLYFQLVKFYNLIDSHIQECLMCGSLNRKCCLCKSGKRLFKYDENVIICRRCSESYHRNCDENLGDGHHC